MYTDTSTSIYDNALNIGTSSFFIMYLNKTVANSFN